MEQIALVVVGALLAGGFQAFGALRAKKTEHERWLREERFAACVAFLQAVDSTLLDGVNYELGNVAFDYVRAFQTTVAAKSAVSLCCPDAVVSVADHLAGLASTVEPARGMQSQRLIEIGVARNLFVAEARKALIQI